MCKTLIAVLMYIWQLPQHIIGTAILFFSKAHYDREAQVYIASHLPGSFSFGCVRLIPSRAYTYYICSTLFGYSVMSVYTGPLYLVLVYIPLLFITLYRRLAKKSFSWYISKYPEHWANQLGEKYYHGKLQEEV